MIQYCWLLSRPTTTAILADEHVESGIDRSRSWAAIGFGWNTNHWYSEVGSLGGCTSKSRCWLSPTAPGWLSPMVGLVWQPDHATAVATALPEAELPMASYTHYTKEQNQLWAKQQLLCNHRFFLLHKWNSLKYSVSSLIELNWQSFWGISSIHDNVIYGMINLF